MRTADWIDHSSSVRIVVYYAMGVRAIVTMREFVPRQGMTGTVPVQEFLLFETHTPVAHVFVGIVSWSLAFAAVVFVDPS